jgi:hypothetical protein
MLESLITITAQPEDIAVLEGNITGSLKVAAEAEPSRELTYQWYSSSTVSNSGGTAITGATNAEFPLPTNLSATNSPFYYYCVVSASGAADVASRTATVTVAALVNCDLGHDLTTVTVAPTCEADGSITETCSRCDYKDVTTIPKLAHIEDGGMVTTPATCQADGHMTITCISCGEVLRTAPIPKLAHIEDGGVVTNPETCQAHGLITNSSETSCE